VQTSITGLAGSLAQVGSGKLRALAVTAATRSAILPDVPSVGEFVAGYEASDWFGVGAPRATPPAIVDQLNQAIAAALADPDVIARFAALGGTPLVLTPAAFAKLLADETEKWGKVVRAANIKPE
jgi:tripartite-type tricarboxylate transporter receptor subunit TctC